MKIKKIFLSFILILSIFCAVACKDKGGEPETETPAPATKAESIIHPSVADRVYVVGEKLADIELLLALGDTSGTIAWKDDSYVLIEGSNSCAWTFTPSDTESFKTKEGTLDITAVKLDIPVVSNVALISGQTAYVDQKYMDIKLQGDAKFNGEAVEGTFSWVEQTKTFVYGVNLCSWKFVPTDSSKYAVVYGTEPISINVVDYQYATAISVETTKLNYEAFQELEIETLTIRQTFNAGKVVDVDFEREDLTITYQNGQESFRRGHTKVTIDYQGISAELENLVIDYASVEIPEPLSNPSYSGAEQTLTVQENEELYTITPVRATDADDYKILVTLIDTDNYKWANGDFETTEVSCTIRKAELVECNIVEVDLEFDNVPHSASVSNQLYSSGEPNQTESKIYYSEEVLNEENYSLLGQTELIEKTNAGNYTIYYYMEGDKNHNGKAGSLSIEISKQTPIMLLEYCYTLKTGSIVNYPRNYVSIVDKQNNLVELEGLSFTYYSSYSEDSNPLNDIKTDSDDGATYVGGAPKNDKATEYFVVAHYAGNQNYEAVQNYTALFIDGADLKFYAKSGEKTFAFKYDEKGFYGATKSGDNYEISLAGSNSECNAYLEFSEKELDPNGLKLVEFSSKFGAGSNNIENGRLVYFDGSYHLLTDENLYRFDYNSDSKEIAVQLGELETDKVSLVKWELPEYLKTYSAKTVSDDDFTKEGYDQTKNKGQNTEITLYNDHGTIRFSAKINVLYEAQFTGDTGGYAEWSGVAEVSFATIKGNTCYVLNCFVINKNGTESSGYSKMEEGFRLSWEVGTVAGNPNPTSMTIDKAIGTSLMSSPFDVLVGVTYTTK